MTYGQHFLINGHRAIILRMMILYLNLLSSGFGTPVSSDIIYFKMNLYDIRNDTLVGNGSNSELAFNCTTEEEYMVEGEPSSIVTETVVEASTNATTLADIVNASAASTGLVMDTTTISSTEDVAEISTTAVINCTTMPEVKWDTTSLRTAVILQSISGNQSEKKNSLQTDFSVMNAALETLDLSMENITLNGTAMSGGGELCWFCNDTEEAQFNCQSGAWQLAECINMLQAERSHGGCYTWRKGKVFCLAEGCFHIDYHDLHFICSAFTEHNCTWLSARFVAD